VDSLDLMIVVTIESMIGLHDGFKPSTEFIGPHSESQQSFAHEIHMLPANWEHA
jgi:hypothetical protein